jgi:Na+/H+ antiporter NhaD/arsenite permease-like protein
LVSTGLYISHRCWFTYISGGGASPDQATGRALRWAFALGADFGGNGTAVAASANVVAIGIAQRTGHPITFWQFTKYGVVVTAACTILAWLYVWIRYF